MFILAQERTSFFNQHAVENQIAWLSMHKRCIAYLLRLLLHGMFLSALNWIWVNRELLIIKLNSYFLISKSFFLIIFRMAFLILKPSSTSCFYSLLLLCFLSVYLLSLGTTVGLSAKINRL